MKYKVTFLGLGWYEVEARSRKDMLLQQLGITGPGLFRQRGGFLWQIDGFSILPEGFDFGRLYGFRSSLLRSLFTGQHFPIRQLLLQFSGEFL